MYTTLSSGNRVEAGTGESSAIPYYFVRWKALEHVYK